LSEQIINKKISRRDFIKISAVAGSLLVSGKLLIDLIKDDFVSIKETRYLMGTIINLDLVAESKSAGEAAVNATFAELERLVAIFSHRDPASPLSLLNRTGYLYKPPQELTAVLAKAIEISGMTGGAFDVSIKPLLDLYQESQPKLPGEDAVEEALKLVDFRKLQVTNEEISFSQVGMAVTLDGIAKGFIIDASIAVLKSLGFENVYFEAGGDLMVSGQNEKGSTWKIGIQSPRKEHPGLIARINISNQAVATSGDYYQYFSPDMLNHHIIDPRTGISSSELASVTILSPNAMLSDALATAVMVMGSNTGLEMLEKLADCEAFLVMKDLKTYNTSGFLENMNSSFN